MINIQIDYILFLFLFFQTQQYAIEFNYLFKLFISSMEFPPIEKSSIIPKIYNFDDGVNRLFLIEIIISVLVNRTASVYLCAFAFYVHSIQIFPNDTNGCVKNWLFHCNLKAEISSLEKRKKKSNLFFVSPSQTMRRSKHTTPGNIYIKSIHRQKF